MTKAELIDQIAQKAGLESKGVAEKALSATIEVLRESLVAGESVTLPAPSRKWKFLPARLPSSPPASS